MTAMPTTPGLVEVTWKFQQPTQVNRSQFTSRRRVTILPAAPRWSASVKVVDCLGEAQVRPWRAWFSLLQGQAGQFRLVAVEGVQIAGVTVTVVGANQIGTTLVTTGWGIAGAKLVSGALVTVADQLLQLTADVVADASGNATLMFRPNLRLSPAAGASVVVDRPYALMSLADDTIQWVAGKGQQYTVAFECEESF